MRWTIISCLCSLFTLGIGPATYRAADAENVIAYRGARIFPVSSAPIERGNLVIHKGKIVAVGPEDSTPIPAGAAVFDGAGKTIVPGLVDTHSHIGISSRPHVPANNDISENSGPIQSGLRALDAINPDDPGIRMAVAGGVTTANIMPGSGNAIGGQTLYVKLRGRTIEAMRIGNTKVLGGLKMANGENPKNHSLRGQAPFSRMKIASLQREQFVKARDYQRRWAAYRKDVDAGKSPPPPDSDPAMDALVEVLERKRTVHFHCHRADDLLTALRIAEEFDFEIVLQHATEGWKVVDELVRRKVPVSLTLVDSPGGKLEVAGRLEENAAVLDKAGVKVAINTDDYITESRYFLRTGAHAIRGGMSEDAALRALTLNGALMLHLDDRLGSLEKGKDADFAVLSGPPFSVYTQVLETYIDGVRVFDRTQLRDWAYQVGGFALPAERLPKQPAMVNPLPAVKAPEAPANAAALKSKPVRLAIYASRIHTVGQGTITDGVVLVENGKVSSVGPRAKFTLPPDTPVLTAAVVTPGLIDAHTVIPLTGKFNVRGDQEQDELSDPNQADLRVLDGFNPNEPLLEFFREQGVTVVHAVPGRANVIAGQSGIFRTHGRTAEQMALRVPAGLLINLGEIPKSSYTGKQPQSRMGSAGLVRTALTQAQSNARKRAAAKDEDKRPPRNLKLEALELALDRKVPVLFGAHRSDDLVTAMRLAKEFNLKAELHLATEGYLIADILAEAKVPVVAHPPMQRVGVNLETLHSYVGNAAVLADRKLPLAIGTGFEGYVPKTRVLRYETAMAMTNGLGFDRALRAITLDAAQVLGIDDRFGSIQAGKVADLVLYDGDPFEHTSHVTYTLIDGQVVYDRSEYLKLPFARRAFFMSDSAGAGCCMGIW
jgi:imidazolonepropionase-like amidohydrolase